MSSRTLYRLSGGTLIVGSLLMLISSVLGAILYPGHEETTQQLVSSTWSLVILLNIIGSLLFVVGLPGMYLRQAGRAGVLGLIGFILFFFGILLQGVTFSTAQIVILRFLAQKAPQLMGAGSGPRGVFLLLIISGLMQIIGTILLGIATMRARVFPRLAGVFLLVSGVAFLLTIGPFLNDILEVVSFIALAAAFVWCGSQLVARDNEAVKAVAPSAAEAGVSW
ncbi:MAG: hypothetical protein NVSMB27_05670 [Ktedonobacteraceae bacterium]